MKTVGHTNRSHAVLAVLLAFIAAAAGPAAQRLINRPLVPIADG